MRKIKRVVDRIALEKLSKSASTMHIARSLSQMNVIDLVQSLDMGRKSCLLAMTNGDDRCEIYSARGRPDTPSMADYGRRSGLQSAALTEETSRSISTASRPRKRRR